jgi:tRNA(Arg) A34 adenosine deaminase TadA
MCCMALLHSRCARIIFGCCNATGALQSTVHLHEMPNLNHHYAVYGGCCAQVLARRRQCVLGSASTVFESWKS